MSKYKVGEEQAIDDGMVIGQSNNQPNVLLVDHMSTDISSNFYYPILASCAGLWLANLASLGLIFHFA